MTNPEIQPVGESDLGVLLERLSQEVLPTIAWALYLHKCYVGDTLVHFRRLESGVETVLALDMDLLYPYIFPYRCNAIHAAITTYVLETLPCKCILPPGTVGELYRVLDEIWQETTEACRLASDLKLKKGGVLSDQDLGRLINLRRYLRLDLSNLRQTLPRVRSVSPRLETVDEIVAEAARFVARRRYAATRLQRLLAIVNLVPVKELFANSDEQIDDAMKRIDVDDIVGRLQSSRVRRRYVLNRNNRADAFNLALVAAHHLFQLQKFRETSGNYQPQHFLRLATSTPAIIDDCNLLGDCNYDFWVVEKLRLIPQCRQDIQKAKLIADIVELVYHSVLARFGESDRDEGTSLADRVAQEHLKLDGHENRLLRLDLDVRTLSKKISRQRTENGEGLIALKPVEVSRVRERLAELVVGLDDRNFATISSELANDHAEVVTKIAGRPTNTLFSYMATPGTIAWDLMFDLADPLQATYKRLGELTGATESSPPQEADEMKARLRRLHVELSVRKENEVPLRFEINNIGTRKLVLGICKTPPFRTFYWPIFCGDVASVACLQKHILTKDFFTRRGAEYRVVASVRYASQWHDIWSSSGQNTLEEEYVKWQQQATQRNVCVVALQLATTLADIRFDFFGLRSSRSPMGYVMTDVLSLGDIEPVYKCTSRSWRNFQDLSELSETLSRISR